MEVLNRKQWLAIGIVVLLIVFCGYFVSRPTTPSGARDTGGNPYVTIDRSGASELYATFTYDDYSAVRTRIADYVVAEGGTAAGTQVTVGSVKAPYRGNGRVTTFKMTIPEIHTSEQTVEVSSPTDVLEGTFKVVGTDYYVDLYTGKPVGQSAQQ